MYSHVIHTSTEFIHMRFQSTASSSDSSSSPKTAVPTGPAGAAGAGGAVSRTCEGLAAGLRASPGNGDNIAVGDS